MGKWEWGKWGQPLFISRAVRLASCGDPKNFSFVKLRFSFSKWLDRSLKYRKFNEHHWPSKNYQILRREHCER